MKTPQLLTIDALLQRTHGPTRPLIDVRTPPEYAEDHLPGAVNHPVLSTDERAFIGTLNREAGAFEANVRGAALVSTNIGALLAGPLANSPRDWSPIVYCWRGGSRSWSLATVLARIGWRVGLLDGGYRSYRQHIVAEIDRQVARCRFVVVAGPTGSGKTRLLGDLARRGHQVLDLEALADHRGSVLGADPLTEQPSQKAFDGRLWRALNDLDPQRPVWVESESRKIGQLHLPEALITAMRAAVCVCIDAPMAVRVALLLDAYPHLSQADSALCAQLQRLAPLYQDRRVAEWRALADAGRWNALVQRLLTEHYDPAYQRSMARNYREVGSAPIVRIEGTDAVAFDAAATAAVAAVAAGASLNWPAACARSPSAP